MEENTIIYEKNKCTILLKSFFIIFISILVVHSIKYMKLNNKNPKIIQMDMNNKRNINKLKRQKRSLYKSNPNFNHIHISLSFNNDYYLLSSITISSILKNAFNTTFIHFHIIETGDFIPETRKKLSSLIYRLNNNSDFIFYNGSQVIQDFGEEIKTHNYGLGEYCRLLSPEFILEDKVLVLDSGDILVEKDLTELFNRELNDKLVLAVLDPYVKCFEDYPLFLKENYINGGVVLFNTKKWRKMGIYKDIVKFYKAFNYKNKLRLPFQDILNTFLPYLSIGFLPLKYNFQDNPYIEEDECVIFNKSEIQDAKINAIIRHNNKMKPEKGEGDKILKWKYYANLTGFIDEICRKYPEGCNL